MLTKTLPVQMGNVFLTTGSVMEKMTVEITQMKIVVIKVIFFCYNKGQVQGKKAFVPYYIVQMVFYDNSSF